jgi:hypothetical protein
MPALLTSAATCVPARPVLEQEVLKAFERSLMFERKEGKVYSAEELAEASSAVMAARHAEMRDAGKEIGKLLSASNRVVKVGSRGWRRGLAALAPCCSGWRVCV